jgi:tetratricopeptide (TPR) repeat protein
MLLRFTLLLLLAALPARADDTDLARQRYATGKILYERGQYAEALVEMQASKRLSGRVELDYNIGMCLWRLGRGQEAADALERFARARPNDPEAASTWQLIAELRAPKLTPPSVARQPGFLSTGHGRATVAVASLAAASFIATAITGGLALSVRSDYDSGCARACDPVRYDEGRRLAIGTDVLIGISAALTVTTVALAATSGRARKLALSGTGLMLAGTF